MQQIDETAIRVFGIPRLLFMDHAGQALARVLSDVTPRPHAEVVVCCGLGYNGGDGLCAAWHAHQRGYRPRVVLVGTAAQLKEEPAVFARILAGLRVPMTEILSEQDLVAVSALLRRAAVIVDALLGIGLTGPVRPLYARLIALINAARKPIVSADIPSGLDADTGLPRGVAVKAALTVTFGLPKHGLRVGQGPGYAGRVLVDTLGIPNTLLRR